MIHDQFHEERVLIQLRFCVQVHEERVLIQLVFHIQVHEERVPPSPRFPLHIRNAINVSLVVSLNVILYFHY